MRIVIGGEDEVAFRLAEALMGAHEVVLVHGSKASPARLERLDVASVFGSLGNPEVLEKARVGHADVFIACTEEDERNLVACMAAKRLGGARTVCFFHRREWLRPTDRGEQSLAASFGIDMVVWPAERLAREIVKVIETPGALDLEEFFEGRVMLLKYPVAPHSSAAGKTVREAGVPAGVVLVGVRHGDRMSLPRGDTQLVPGDKVFAIGNRAGVGRLASLLGVGVGDARGGPITVVGGGSVGSMVAEGLEPASGADIKVIEPDPVRCEEISRTLRKALVVQGDGTKLDLLESEGVAESRVLVAVTNSDERNLLISLLGKQLGIPRIVTRAGSAVNERLFERVGIDVVRSAQGTAIQAVLADLIGGRSRLLAEVEHGDARVLQIDVPEGMPARRLKEMHAPVFAIVGAIERAGKTIIPRGDDEVKGGDRIVVFCDAASEPTARTFFEHGNGGA